MAVVPLATGYVITPNDVEAALTRQAVTVGRGAALLLHTGWGQQWMVDNDGYLNGEPGMTLAAWPAAAGVTEFMLVLSHANVRGATGAWVVHWPLCEVDL